MKPAFLFFTCMWALLLGAQNTRFEWAKQFSGGRNMSNAVKTDAAGNVYTSGNFTGTVDVDLGPRIFNLRSSIGNYDAFLSKQDAQGNLLWAINLRTMGNVHLFDTLVGWQFNSIAVHASTGDIYVSGLFTGTIDADPGGGIYNLTAAPNEAATYICKISTEGKFLWAKQVGGQKPQVTHYQGPGGNYIIYNWYYWNHGIAADASGNVCVAGIFQGTRDFDPNAGVFHLQGSSMVYNNNNPITNEGLYVVKLDANGNFVWAKTPRVVSPFTYPSGEFYGSVNEVLITLDPAGNLYCSGYFTGRVDFDPSDQVFTLDGEGGRFLWKLTSNGDFAWATKVPFNAIEYISSIVADEKGNIYATGGNHDYFTEGSDGVIAKFNANGVIAWTKLIEGLVCDYAGSYVRKITLDAGGNILVGGYFGGKVDFDPGPDHYFLGTGALFILSLSSEGRFSWVRTIQSGNTDWLFEAGIDLTTDNTGNIYTAPIFGGHPGRMIDFNHGGGVFTLGLTGDTTRWGYVYNSFLHKMGPCAGSTRSSVTATSCGNYKLNDYIYTTSGIYTQTIPNTEGCDSLITLNLTISRQYVKKDIYATACKSYSWRCRVDSTNCQLQCTTYTQSGTYLDTVAGINACDTIVALHLTIQPPAKSTLTKTICFGESYLGYNQSGTFIDSFPTDSGCDSIRVLELTVLPQARSTIVQTICRGQSFFGYHVSGTYLDTLTTANGCDSVRILQLTVLSQLSSVLTKTICRGEAFEGYTASGTYTDTLKSVAGCDSIRTLQLTVLPLPKPTLGPDVALCEGETKLLTAGAFDSYLWQDGSAGPSFTAATPGLYWAEVANRCGRARDEVLITSKPCDVYFPSAFTPNGDGRNDVFRVLGGSSMLRNYRLSVFNRWGQKIFETADPSKGWTGHLADPGAYVWYSTFKKAGNIKTTQMKGTVFLMR